MGKTVIFTSHLLEQAQEVADRVAIFSLGKKVLEGSLESLLTENQSTQINIPTELSAEQQQRLRQALAQAWIAGDAGESGARVYASHRTPQTPEDNYGGADHIGSGIHHR